jgi:hypothetical protein
MLNFENDTYKNTYKNTYPITTDSWRVNTNLFIPSKVGIVVYGSLCKHLGELSESVEKEVYDGPVLKISLNGCNKIKKNLARILDYENGIRINTIVKIFKKNLTLDEIKDIILLREGNINYISYYDKTDDRLHNIPYHLSEPSIIENLKLKMYKTSLKLELDYLFFITYPPRIKDPLLYIINNKSTIRDTKNYLKKCDSKTLNNLEKKILSL